MSRGARILRNTISNAALQGVQSLTGLVLLPLLIGYFGKEVYGINAYVEGIVAIFNFFAQALSMSMTKFVPEFLASRQEEKLNNLIFSLLPFSLALYVVLGCAIIVFPVYGLGWFNVPSYLVPMTSRLMMVLGISTMLQFALPLVGGILSGMERFHLANKIYLVNVLTMVAAYVYVVNTNGSLVTYVCLTQVGYLSYVFILGIVATRLLPMKLRLVRPKFRSIREVTGFNLFLIANQVSDHLMYTADRLILQRVIGATAVTEYYVASRPKDIAQNFISMPLGAVLPSLSRSFAAKDLEFVRRINAEGANLYLALVVPPLLALYFVFDHFVRLWVGPSFLDIVGTGRLFLLTVIVAAPFKVFSHSLVAKARVKEMGWVKFIFSIVNVAASYYLAIKWGLIGVVVPTAIFWMVIYPFTLFLVMRSESFVDSRDFNRLLIKVVLMTILCAASSGFISPLLGIHSWLSFCTHLICAYLLFLGMFVAISDGGLIQLAHGELKKALERQ